MSQTPSVGRIVHYRGRSDRYDGQPVAAIITEVNPSFCDDQWYDMAGLDESMASKSSVVRLDIRWPDFVEPFEYANLGNLYPYSETPKAGHWNWPPRV